MIFWSYSCSCFFFPPLNRKRLYDYLGGPALSSSKYEIGLSRSLSFSRKATVNCLGARVVSD